MHLDWIILHPAMPFAASAIGLSLCLLLFVSLKRDLRAGEARSSKKLAALETDWSAKMENLDERWKELSQVSESADSSSAFAVGAEPEQAKPSPADEPPG